jgi:DNA topoisomerase IB
VTEIAIHQIATKLTLEIARNATKIRLNNLFGKLGPVNCVSVLPAFNSYLWCFKSFPKKIGVKLKRHVKLENLLYNFDEVGKFGFSWSTKSLVDLLTH